MRTTLMVLMIALLSVLGCTDKREREELARKNEDLAKQLASRDRFIEDVTGTINEIHDNLEATWAKEKNVVRQTTKDEGKVGATSVELKQRIIDRIAGMHTVIMESRKKMALLQQKLNESGKQYAGLQRMVDDLKKEIEEREQAIAELKARVGVLETEVSEKSAVIAAHQNTIDKQTEQLNTVYYMVGTRDELKKKGIITREGGVLWGLFGGTTVLASDFAEADFQALDKTKDHTIALRGLVDEIVPKRDTSLYTIVRLESGQTELRIINPDSFWRERRLVIVAE